MCTDNEKFDAQMGATTEPETAANEAAANKKSDSVGPPARPQPPVCITTCVVSADVNVYN